MLGVMLVTVVRRLRYRCRSSSAPLQALSRSGEVELHVVYDSSRSEAEVEVTTLNSVWAVTYW